MIRNSIEDFIKFTKLSIKEIDKNSKPSDIFDTIFEHLNCQKDEFLHKNFEILKSIYSDSCLYIHSANIQKNNSKSCLMEHINSYNIEALKNEVDKLCKIVNSFNNIICVHYINVFKKMKVEYQFIIRDYMDKNSLEEIYKRLASN